MAKDKKIPYSEMNRQRVEKMLDRDPGAVKAVVANTIETRKVAGKLTIVDIIFNQARQNVGHRIDMKDFIKILDKFNEIDKAFDELIETATQKGIYVPRDRNKVSDFQKNKEALEALIASKKTIKQIAKELNIDEEKAKAWIGIVEKENVPAENKDGAEEAKKAS